MSIGTSRPAVRDQVYDSFGNRVLVIDYNKDGSVKDRREFIYDEFNNVVERIYYKDDGSVYYEDECTYKYRYIGE